MKKGGGRNKGSSFERSVARMLIEAFAPFGISQEHCYRTPGSGGHRFACKTDPGDLVLERRFRKLWNVCIECKHYRKLTIEHLMETPWIGHFPEWWEQVRRSSLNAKGAPIPLLVFKWDRSDVFALMYKADLVALTKRWSTLSRVEVLDVDKQEVVLLKFAVVLKRAVRAAQVRRGVTT